MFAVDSFRGDHIVDRRNAPSSFRIHRGFQLRFSKWEALAVARKEAFGGFQSVLRKKERHLSKPIGSALSF